MRRTLHEVAEVMMNNGVRPDVAERILTDLGFPPEKVREVISRYRALVGDNPEVESSGANPEKRTNGNGRSLTDSELEKIADRATIEEVLARHQKELERLDQEVMRLVSEVSAVSRKLKVLEGTSASRSVEERVRRLEARLEALIDTLCDLAPGLLEEFRRRGLR